MTIAIFPDGKRIHMEEVASYYASSTTVTINYNSSLSAYTYTAVSASAATKIINQLDKLTKDETISPLSIVDTSLSVITVSGFSDNPNFVANSQHTVSAVGTGFQTGMNFTIDGQTPPNLHVTNSTGFTFTLPSIAAATYTLVLTNPDGGSLTFPYSAA